VCFWSEFFDVGFFCFEFCYFVVVLFCLSVNVFDFFDEVFVLLCKSLVVVLCSGEFLGGVFKFFVVLLKCCEVLCALSYRLVECGDLCV